MSLLKTLLLGGAVAGALPFAPFGVGNIVREAASSLLGSGLTSALGTAYGGFRGNRASNRELVRGMIGSGSVADGYRAAGFKRAVGGAYDAVQMVPGYLKQGYENIKSAFTSDPAMGGHLGDMTRQKALQLYKDSYNGYEGNQLFDTNHQQPSQYSNEVKKQAYHEVEKKSHHTDNAKYTTLKHPDFFTQRKATGQYSPHIPESQRKMNVVPDIGDPKVKAQHDIIGLIKHGIQPQDQNLLNFLKTIQGYNSLSSRGRNTMGKRRTKYIEINHTGMGKYQSIPTVAIGGSSSMYKHIRQLNEKKHKNQISKAYDYMNKSGKYHSALINKAITASKKPKNATMARYFPFEQMNYTAPKNGKAFGKYKFH